jgi:uncharacterized protein
VSALLLLLLLLGHWFLWVALLNRIHARHLPRWFIDASTAVCFFMLGAAPLAVAGWLYVHDFTLRIDSLPSVGRGAVLAYLALCLLGSAIITVDWIRRHLLHRPPAVLRSQRHEKVKLALTPVPGNEADHAHHFLVHLPGNESLQLDLAERRIDVPRLPAALEGLSLVHLSDLHFTGHVGKAYFQEVVRASNALQPDLVTITGDLVDKSRYISWIPETLGRLESRYGVFAVLGNHDIRTDVPHLIATLEQCGLVYLGGRWQAIDVRGQRLVLAGNELPWRGPAADLSGCPPRSDAPFRIVLSHSPDQLPWAQQHDADLMLAGHVHGGQIRVPLVGPIFSPSRDGVRYACGLFHAPPTILHVSRGISGETPLRMNCPPELAHLVLHRAPEH